MFLKSALKRMTRMGKAVDPGWNRNENGKLFRFISLDPEEQGISGRTGIFAIWHGGVRPTWVFIGQSRDLARDLHWCGENEEIMHYERFGGLFCSWAFVKPEFQPGAVRYLTQIAKPVVQNPLAPGTTVEAIAVTLPGGKG